MQMKTPEEYAKDAILPETKWCIDGVIDLSALHTIVSAAIREAEDRGAEGERKKHDYQ